MSHRYWGHFSTPQLHPFPPRTWKRSRRASLLWLSLCKTTPTVRQLWEEPCICYEKWQPSTHPFWLKSIQNPTQSPLKYIESGIQTLSRAKFLVFLYSWFVNLAHISVESGGHFHLGCESRAPRKSQLFKIENPTAGSRQTFLCRAIVHSQQLAQTSLVSK